jgi:hypothetical protein
MLHIHRAAEYERVIRECSSAVSNIHEYVHGAKIQPNNSPNFHIHIHIREYEYESNMFKILMFIFANMNIRPSLIKYRLTAQRWRKA